ncbi:hypothetical protein [Bacteroides sp.]
MGEINTRGMVRDKISSFPSGADSQCLTKSEVLAYGVAMVSGSYVDNECVMITDIQGKAINYMHISEGYDDRMDENYMSVYFANPVASNMNIEVDMDGSIIGIYIPKGRVTSHDFYDNTTDPDYIPTYSIVNFTPKYDDTYIYKVE